MRAAVSFKKKLMVSVGISWNRETIFFINPQKTKVDQNCYIDLLKTPHCLNVVDIIRAMTLNFCKIVLRHTAQK